MSSLEVLQAQFESHEASCQETASAVKELRVMIDAKVDFKHFYWVIGILVTIQMAVLGFIIMQNQNVSNQIDEVSKITTTLQIDSSSLKGILSNYDIKITK